MYIPSHFLASDREEIISFMKRYNFASIITAPGGCPTATHLPFVIVERGAELVLISHFAKANPQWKDIETSQCLVIFAEPHAYISPIHYDKELNVPTWNYIAIHAYGLGQIIHDTAKALEIMELSIDAFDSTYRAQWERLPQDYKLKMIQGIVAFEIVIKDLQGKNKLSQNKSEVERERIITSLSKGSAQEQQIAEYMRKKD
ncbi:MAG TPA: FMN-binding negative transcriptional regulator [Cytophagales bacterium]|nr:FMN-binding negative transcriptional regulator [Cytophagales bacterium]